MKDEKEEREENEEEWGSVGGGEREGSFVLSKVQSGERCGSGRVSSKVGSTKDERDKK